MKHMLFLLSLAGFSIWSIAKHETPYLQQDAYVIESAVPDTTIKKGMCVIEAVVQDQNGNLIKGALISSIDKRKKAYTNESGFCSLTISSLDTSVFMFHENYGEIVLDKYDFKSRYRVRIRFNVYDKNAEPERVKKPVIYVYADEPTDISVSLEHPGMTFQYPPYQNGWNVQANALGQLTDLKTGKMHPYLFWEAEASNIRYVAGNSGTAGFLMATDTLVSFFENSLSQLGLTTVEQTDFITFWAPQLTQSPYVFLQFLIDNAYSEYIAPIAVNPLPDSQRRVFMLYTPLNHPGEFPTTILTQALPGFDRSGLTLVEWGGAAVPLKKLQAN